MFGEAGGGRSNGDTTGLVTFDVDRESDTEGVVSDGSSGRGGESDLATTGDGGDAATGGGVGVLVGGVTGSGSAIVCV
jgi:hypothetical protein